MLCHLNLEKIHNLSRFRIIFKIIKLDLQQNFKFMTENMFDDLWKNVFEAASKKSVDYSAFYPTHQIRKLSLPKLRISEIQQKVAQFAIRYNSRHHTNSKTWMENQYRIFLWAILNYSEMVSRAPLQFNFQDWNLLSKMFDKPPILCNYFYMCSRKGRNSAWTEQQDKFLCEVMKIPQYKGRWTDIGMLLFFQTGSSCFRKPKAIRQRWLNHLNPQIIKYQWSLEEDLVIFNMVLEEGKRWSKISRTLKNRSEHAIKNRYNGLIGQKIRNSSFQTKAIKEEKAIKTYISKIKNILSTQKKEEMQISEQKIIERTGEKKEDQHQSEEPNSLFNYGLNSVGFCIFQPTLIIHPQNKL